MDKFERGLEMVQQELVPQWSEERGARLYAATLQRGRRRVVARTGLLSLASIAAAVALGVGLRHPTMPSSKTTRATSAVAGGVQAGSSSSHTLRLIDGSRAELMGAQSEVEVASNGADRIVLRLLSGRAHFDVVHNPQRSFVVEAAPYRVAVIGTVFDVERTAQGVSVGVSRGKVRVYGPTGAEDIVAGQTRQFAPGPAVATTLPTGDEPPAELESDAPPPAAAHTRTTRQAAVPDWRSLSQSGQYDAAYKSLRGVPQVVENDPAALLDAADAARLSGHPQDAVQYLERVVREHGKSPVAPLAAFTLGRVYLDRLGQPGRAAETFALARRLAPSGSLAQDALAREVEALSKGGNTQKAYLRAQEYLKDYPNGARLRSVQLYGGLE